MQVHAGKPEVRLIARTQIDWEALDGVLEERGYEWNHAREPALTRSEQIGMNLAVDGQDGALLAEYAGRGCYNSFGGPNGAGMGRKTNQSYIDHIIEVGHGSVLEHAWYTFAIWGASRGFTHELVRHRVGVAFSQASTRFRDEGKFGRVVVPPIFRDNPEMVEKYRKLAEETEARYLELMADAEAQIGDTGLDKLARRKTARGAARSGLLIGLEAPITVSMNLRQIRNFLDQRASPFAEVEIREVAMLVFGIMREVEPAIFADYEIIECEDGTEAAKTAHPKV